MYPRSYDLQLNQYFLSPKEIDKFLNEAPVDEHRGNEDRYKKYIIYLQIMLYHIYNFYKNIYKWTKCTNKEWNYIYNFIYR